MKKKDATINIQQQIELNNKLIASAKTLIDKMGSLCKSNNVNSKDSMFFIEKFNPSKNQLQKSLASIKQKLSNNTENNGNKNDDLPYKVFQKKTI